jgi:hypothetical protein
MNEDRNLATEEVNKGEVLEKGEDLVKENLSSKKYFLHGNSSTVDSENIAKQGLEVTEGRATVSCNLVHAFIWATSAEKRDAYSLSETPTEEDSVGSVFVIEKPEQYSFGFGIFTGFELYSEEKVIRGQPIKWASAYKQIGIFSDEIVDLKRKQIEVKNKDERSESKLIITPIYRLYPSEQAFQVLRELEVQSKTFKRIDIQNMVATLQDSLGLESSIVRELVESTIESIVITRLSLKALEIKATQGYIIHNYASKPTGRFNKSQDKIKEDLLEWQNTLREEETLGIDWLDEYANANIEHLLGELET